MATDEAPADYSEFMGLGKATERTFETEVPIGFNHSALLEPYRTRYFVEDEIVKDCEIEVDPAHRGIERILQGLSVDKANVVTERICGICSHGHIWNSVRTADIGLGTEIPKAAVAIRVMGEEGFAEVLTNGGWRAVTRDGAMNGDGAMNYDADMAPYIQEMADWLDDDKKVHCCNFTSAYKGFEIMMGICRSVVDGGQVSLPLHEPGDEIDALREKMADCPVTLAHPDHAAEFGM